MDVFANQKTAVIVFGAPHWSAGSRSIGQSALCGAKDNVAVMRGKAAKLPPNISPDFSTRIIDVLE